MKKIDIRGIDETVYYGKCDNGLKVYMWVNPKVKSTFMSLSIKYGSVHTKFTHKNKKYEVPNGTAHFLEHLKFNEKDGTTAHDFYYRNGAEVNAFTTFDYTSYHVYALNNVEKNLIHLLDFVQEPYFTKEMVEKEKGIIIEEEKMGEDDPSTLHYYGIFNSLLENSNYKNLITGNIDDIKNTTLDDINNVFNTFYHPENMFLCLTGNFNPHELMEVIKLNQNNKDFKEYSKPTINKLKENKKVVREYHEVSSNVAMPKVKIGVKIPRKNFKDLSDLEIRIYLSLILNINFGSTSDFKDYLIENNLASSINSMADIYDDYVIIKVGFETRFYEEISKVVKEKLDNMSITEKEVNRKLKAQIATLILGYDDVEDVNYKLQDNIINYSKIIDDIKEEYEKVTYEDLEKFIKELDMKNYSIHVIKPKQNTDK